VTPDFDDEVVSASCVTRELAGSSSETMKDKRT
jgi:hypothetical protein